MIKPYCIKCCTTGKAASTIHQKTQGVHEKSLNEVKSTHTYIVTIPISIFSSNGNTFILIPNKADPQ